jgi:hypothetical protein
MNEILMLVSQVRDNICLFDVKPRSGPHALSRRSLVTNELRLTTASREPLEDLPHGACKELRTYHAACWPHCEFNFTTASTSELKCPITYYHGCVFVQIWTCASIEEYMLMPNIDAKCSHNLLRPEPCLYIGDILLHRGAHGLYTLGARPPTTIVLVVGQAQHHTSPCEDDVQKRDLVVLTICVRMERL